MVKVAIVGAGGGIGQPLSLLTKLNPNVTELALIDVAPLVKGVAADLSHIPTKAKISFHVGADARPGLAGAQLVLVPAGVPRKPGMTRDDLFAINAGIVKGIAEAVADVCPDAFVGVISNPVNSTVPIFVEAIKAKRGSCDAKKILGVTSLDLLRASTFLAEKLPGHPDPASIHVPIVGGHAGKTIVPLFSQTVPKVPAPSDSDLAALVDRTQNGGTEVVEAKEGAGSATLSMAQAAAVFTTYIVQAIQGKEVSLCAYVASPLYESAGCSYFSSPVTVGPNGITGIPALPEGLTAVEKSMIEGALAELKGSISKGIEFVAKKNAEAKN
eukprot:TRINITY_DN829_c0_g1_i2.p1 TRINITY_DN829_c0_g1~~TRINITY_DN829_c0_g1_i2.p1  ORF type:complete len:328 (+),score=68.63 TRINITY_DN829_c0_g1_i2:192-1175(+)